MPPQTAAHKAKLSAAMKAYHKNFCNTEVPYVKPVKAKKPKKGEEGYVAPKKKPKKGEEGYVAPVRKAKAGIVVPTPGKGKKVPPPVAPKPKKKVPPPVAPKPKKKEVPRTTKKGFGIRRIKKGFGIKRLPKPPADEESEEEEDKELPEDMKEIMEEILGEEEFEMFFDLVVASIDEINGPWEDEEEYTDLYEVAVDYYNKITDSDKIDTLYGNKLAKAFLEEADNKTDIMAETVTAYNAHSEPNAAIIKLLEANPKIIYP